MSCDCTNLVRLANAGEIDELVHAGLLEHVGAADARALEYRGRAHRTAADHDHLVRADRPDALRGVGLQRLVRHDLGANGLVALEDDALDLTRVSAIAERGRALCSVMIRRFLLSLWL